MIDKQLFNSGQQVQDGTDTKTFNKLQGIAGGSTLPPNPVNPIATPLGEQEGAQINTALHTNVGNTTEINPGTGEAQTIEKIYNNQDGINPTHGNL
jgi:hypothetical protein